MTWWVFGLAALGAAVAAVWYWTDIRVEKQAKTTPTSSTTLKSHTAETGSSDVTWVFNGEMWEASGTPPACAKPIKLATPTSQLSQATSILYPGQQRSTGYKPHGAFRFDRSANADIDVLVPLDGHLVSASRYLEQGDTQYLVAFTTPCGLSYRFDHLLTLTPKFQVVADALPAAHIDDSRTTPIEPPLAVSTGEAVATAVGFATTPNVMFDFGLYDLRIQNAASKDPAWAAKHADDNQLAPYAVCWFDFLPAADSAAVKALPSGDSTTGTTSDYCR